MIVKLTRSQINPGRILSVQLLEYGKNLLQLDFTSELSCIDGKVLYDHDKVVRQCYLLTAQFLLLLTDDYLELINTQRYRSAPRQNNQTFQEA